MAFTKNGSKPFRPSGMRGPGGATAQPGAGTPRIHPGDKPLPKGETNPYWESKCPDKTCHWGHTGSCLSNPAFAGPPSRELREKDDGKPLARIEQRRKDTAKRLGVTNVAWAKGKNVSISLLEIPAVAKKPGSLCVLRIVTVRFFSLRFCDKDRVAPETRSP